jgi:hypothetical protein
MAKLSYLASLAQEIDKFAHETEEEAKQLIDKDLTDLRIKKKMVMDQARGALADHREAITNLAVELDKIGASLSNDLPSSKDSEKKS